MYKSGVSGVIVVQQWITGFEYKFAIFMKVFFFVFYSFSIILKRNIWVWIL